MWNHTVEGSAFCKTLQWLLPEAYSEPCQTSIWQPSNIHPRTLTHLRPMFRFCKRNILSIYPWILLFYYEQKNKPSKCFFQSRKIKFALFNCRQMTGFPMLQAAAKTYIAKTVTINVFAENNIYEGQMVECIDCSEWFHGLCERVPDAMFCKKNSKCHWFCYPKVTLLTRNTPTLS